MGRPKKDIKRSEVVRVRFTITEKRLLKHYAQSNGLTTAEFVRDRSMNYKIIQRLNNEERNYMRQLIGMARNLNTLALKANLGEITHSEMSRFLLDVNNQIEKLR